MQTANSVNQDVTLPMDHGLDVSSYYVARSLTARARAGKGTCTNSASNTVGPRLCTRPGRSFSADRSCHLWTHVQDVLEKQADIIRFMKQHNESLSRRIRTLTEQLACYEQGEVRPTTCRGRCEEGSLGWG